MRPEGDGTAVWHRGLVAIACLAMAALPAHAATLYVGNNGNDAFVPPCGAKITPCRSISKAISLAGAGDTIKVGPGVYGDLNQNGTFEPALGEEAAEVGTGCNCMIKVDKRLTIQSRDGARVTILDGFAVSASLVHIISPAADGSIFGKPSKGFTIRNGGSDGLLTDPSAQKVKVQGNMAVFNTTGFNISGNGGGTTSLLVADNIARDNSGSGFVVSGSSNKLQRNRAMRNGYAGIVIGGTTHTVTQNVSTRNGMHGFEIGLSPSAGHPLATFSKNSAVANRHVGIHVVAQSAMGPPVVLAKNNLYGNDEAQNNCGLFVDNADTGHMLKVTATGNFWGASTGPGTNPADAVGGVCNLDAGGGINLNTNSPATKEFGVGEKPLK